MLQLFFLCGGGGLTFFAFPKSAWCVDMIGWKVTPYLNTILKAMAVSDKKFIFSLDRSFHAAGIVHSDILILR